MKRVVRLFVVLLPLALLAGTVPASANDEAGYLALGDSVAFGFSPLVSPTDTDAYVGYPEVLSKHVVNAACSGETSGSLIAGPPDNGCAAFRSVAPLHVSYTGTQLAFPTLLSTLASHLVTIYASLRAAGFTGHLVALTYYLTNYNDPNQLGALGAINQVVSAVTTQFGGRVADGFGAFQAEAAEAGGDSCAAGLLIRRPTGGCDIHPSKTGQKLLAEAIEDVS